MNLRFIRNFWTKKKPNFGAFSFVEPGTISETRVVPDYIPKPVYYESGDPGHSIDAPEIKQPAQIEQMRKSCKLAAEILCDVASIIRVGTKTDEIDAFVHKLTIAHGAYPSPLNYRNFPKSVCTSVNNVACHGIPDDRRLRDGDIINVDVTVFYENYHGDCSKTFLVGDVDEDGHNLVQITEMCLNEAIGLCKPGRKFNEIGHYIETKAKLFGYQVVPQFLGHGIGTYFHGPPDIYHIKNRYPGTMKPGMTFTIEPVITQGDPNYEILDDKWTAVTVDGARTAQFEHTVLITNDGAEILTKIS